MIHAWRANRHDGIVAFVTFAFTLALAPELELGILLDMVQELYGDKRRLNRDQVIASATQLGEKYSFDEQHGKTVARLALAVFDQVLFASA